MFTPTYEDCREIWKKFIKHNPSLKFSSNDFVKRALTKLGKPLRESNDSKIIRKHYRRFKEEYKRGIC